MTQTLAVAAAAEAGVTSCPCRNSGRLHGLQIHNMSQRFSGAFSCWVKTQTASQPGTCMNLHQCAKANCLQVSFLWTKVTAETTERWLAVSQTLSTKFSWHLKKKSANLYLSINSSRNNCILISQYREAAVGKTKQKTTNRPQQRRPNFTVRRRPLT